MALKDLVLRFRLDDQVSRKLGQFGKHLNKSLSSLGTAGRVIKGIGLALGGMAVSAAALGGVVLKRTISRLDTIADTAKRLQTTTDVLQELAFAARFSDIEFDKFITGLSAFNANRKKLGLKGDLKQDLLQVAATFEKIKGTAARSEFLKRVFLKGGKDFAPLLEGGPKRLLALIEEAHRRGLIRSQEEVQAASDIDDNIKHLKDTLLGFEEGLAGRLLPTVKDLTGRLDQWLQSKEGLEAINRASKGIADASIAMAEAIPKFAPSIERMAKIVEFLASRKGLPENLPEFVSGNPLGFRPLSHEIARFTNTGGVPAHGRGTGDMTLTVRLLDPRGLLVGQGKGALRPGGSMDVSADVGPVMATQ